MFSPLLARLKGTASSRSRRQRHRGRSRAVLGYRLAAEQMEPRLLLTATQLAADINQDPASIYYEAYDTAGVELGGKFYFVGSTETGPTGSHHEIWSYDPLTNGGTGIASKAGEVPIEGSWTTIYEMTVLGDKIYFLTDSDTSDLPLWEFDPATGEAKTVGVLSSDDSPQGSAYLTPLDGKLYFSSYDETHGRELWQFDPNDNGGTISLVVDIAPGSDSSYPGFLTALNGKLYFSADDGIHGDELYEYDPVTGTAQLAADINLGEDSSWPYHLVAMGDKLYFGADDGINGYELWQYDPSGNNGAGEASLTIDVVADGDFNPEFMTALGDSIYFSANDGLTGYELWRYTPGASGGTGEMRLVQDLYSGPDSGDPYEFTVAAGKLYFSADDGNTGYELWEYDPVSDTLSLAIDLWEGEASSDPIGLVAVGDAVLFNADDGWHHYGLWEFDTTDNSGAGIPFHVMDTSGATTSSFPDYLTALDGKLYFTAYTVATGHELWEYSPGPNGTRGAAKMVADIFPGAVSSDPHSLTTFEGKLYFVAEDEVAGEELWRYDPAANGGLGELTLLADLAAGNVSFFPRHLTILDSTLYFTARHEQGVIHLWALDLTADDATPLPIIEEDFQIAQMIAFNGHLYFRSHDGTHGFEPWYFNPATMEAPARLADLSPGSGSSWPSPFTIFDGKLYFTANNGTMPVLWQVDPTAVGGAGAVTMALASSDYQISYFSGMVTLDGKLFFAATIDGDQTHLLQYVPSAIPGQPGTAVVVGGMAHDSIWELSAAGGHIYFTASDEQHGQELWEFIPGSDGGTGTMRLVADIFPGTPSSYPYALTELDGRLYFGASHPIYGDELWVHDPNAFSIGDGSRVELSFARGNVPVGTVQNNGPSTGSSFHEWEDATGQLWLTIDEDLPAAPFDLIWEMTSSGTWFLEPQLQSHLGTDAGSLTTILDGAVLRTTGTIAGLDLSGMNVGDRVLIATLVYPVDVENGVGVAMSQAGAHPSANAAHGVQLVSVLNGTTGQMLDKEEDVAGQFVPIIYDADDNGAVGLSDFSGFVSYFGRVPSADDPGAYRFDYDRNGKVGLSDFVLFVRHFGTNKVEGYDGVDMPGLLGGTQANLAPQGFSSESSTFLLEGEPVGEDSIVGFSLGYEWEPSIDLHGLSKLEPIELPGFTVNLRSLIEQPQYVLDLDTLQLVPYLSATSEVDATFGEDEWEADVDLSWVNDLDFVGPLPPPSR